VLPDNGNKEGRPNEEDPAHKVPLIETFEGSILLAGGSIAIVSVVGLLVGSVLSPEKIQIITGMTASHLVFGRAAGMTFGYTLGLGHDLVVPINMLIETVLVMLFYPLFVFSWRRVVVIPALKSFMDRTQAAAEAHQDKIRRYGIIGLFVFVWLPFWMTGPLVGCIIGFFLGLRGWMNLAIVLAGTYVAILGYAFLLKDLHDRAASVGPYASFVLLGAIIAVVIGAHLLGRRNQKKKDETDRSGG